MVYWIEDAYRNTLWSEENLKAAGIWDEATSFSAIEIPQITIFPNPAKNEINY